MAEDSERDRCAGGLGNVDENRFVPIKGAAELAAEFFSPLPGAGGKVREQCFRHRRDSAKNVFGDASGDDAGRLLRLRAGDAAR